MTRDKAQLACWHGSQNCAKLDVIARGNMEERYPTLSEKLRALSKNSNAENNLALISSAYYHGGNKIKSALFQFVRLMAIFSLYRRKMLAFDRESRTDHASRIHTQAWISFFHHFGPQTATPVHYWMPIFIVPDLSINSQSASTILAHSTRYHILPRNRAVTAAVLIVTRIIGSLRLCIGIHSSVRFRIQWHRKYAVSAQMRIDNVATRDCWLKYTATWWQIIDLYFVALINFSRYYRKLSSIYMYEK